jgi:D-aminoacyl-tRNA deacylase
MRAVVQRVKRAEVRVGEEVVGRIGVGFVVLLGIWKNDTEAAGKTLAQKIASLKILEDENGTMCRSLAEAGGKVLCVSQFTLYGDCWKGRRPSYDQAASPEQAVSLYENFVKYLRELQVPTETGRFRATMDVELVNDGPMTLLIDSEKQF